MLLSFGPQPSGQNVLLDAPSEKGVIVSGGSLLPVMTATTGTKLRIYLIDDHPVVREGFARAVADQPDMEVVGQAATAADSLAQVKDIRPEIVLVDLNLPDRDGPELIAALR